MYGLSRDLDLSFLSGRQVTHVTIAVYQIAFGFDEDLAISVHSQFGYFDGHDEWVWTPEPGGAHIAARTVALLDSTIESFQGHEDGTLKLIFSNGQRLTILDNSRAYESYDITWRGPTIVV